MNSKKRHTCIVCKKKRYDFFMLSVPVLLTEATTSSTSNHWCCKDCINDYISRLSNQVGQLRKIISKLSLMSDVNNSQDIDLNSAQYFIK